jgi:NAD-dependent deacetylase
MKDVQAVLRAAAAEIATAPKQTIAVTGAGISVPSGIPAFRGMGGLWEKYDPEEYATIDAFHANPGKVWRMIREFREVIERARPNPAHLALARLEKLGYLRTVITQNVDGLHQAAGNRDVIEFHGNNRWVLCLRCGARLPGAEVVLETLPPRCSCGGVLKPNVVFFGEPIPPEALSRSYAEATRCRVVLVVGTSAQVQPAASIPFVARSAGARIVEVNPERCLPSDYCLTGPAEELLPALVSEVEQLAASR